MRALLCSADGAIVTQARALLTPPPAREKSDAEKAAEHDVARLRHALALAKAQQRPDDEHYPLAFVAGLVTRMLADVLLLRDARCPLEEDVAVVDAGPPPQGGGDERVDQRAEPLGRL